MFVQYFTCTSTDEFYQVAEFFRAYFHVLGICDSILIGIFDVDIDWPFVRRKIGICHNHSITNLKEKTIVQIN